MSAYPYHGYPYHGYWQYPHHSTCRCAKDKCHVKDKYCVKDEPIPPEPIPPKQIVPDHFTEYIVVGVGASGAIVAKQLSDGGHQVIALDSGTREDANPLVVDPSKNSYLLSGDINKFFTRYSGTSDGLEVSRVFGGGTTVGGMQYVSYTDDYWHEVYLAADKDPAWNTPNIRSIAKRLENFNGSGNQSMHGTDGPVDIRVATINESASKLFSEAVNTTTNVSTLKDYNDFEGDAEGSFIKWQLLQTPDKKRVTTSTAYLSDTMRVEEEPVGPNDYRKEVYLDRNNRLKIYSNATVSKITYCDTMPATETPLANGVIAFVEGKEIHFKASKGVILCGGLSSPAILQRSGIGERALLEALDIPVIVDNNRVGFGLANHSSCGILAVPDTNQIPGSTDDPEALYAGGTFLKDVTSDDPLRRSIEITQLTSAEAQVSLFLCNYLRLRSTGTVKIQQYDPLKPPLVKFNPLTYVSDIYSHVEMIKTVITIMNKMGLKPVDVLSSDAQIEAFVKISVGATYHWTGGCKVGANQSLGVVDHNFKVFGVNGLYICDNMVLPASCDGNTAAAAMYLAYIFTDKILNNPPLLYTCPFVILPPIPPPLVLAPETDTSEFDPIKTVYKTPKF